MNLIIDYWWLMIDYWLLMIDCWCFLSTDDTDGTDSQDMECVQIKSVESVESVGHEGWWGALKPTDYTDVTDVRRRTGIIVDDWWLIIDDWLLIADVVYPRIIRMSRMSAGGRDWLWLLMTDDWWYLSTDGTNVRRRTGAWESVCAGLELSLVNGYVRNVCF